MPINAWIVNDSKLKYLARKYRISEYLLTAINVKNHNDVEKIAIANKVALDREFYEAHMVATDKLTFFAKPEALKFETEKSNDSDVVRIIIRYKTAVVVWKMPREEYMKHKPTEWLELFKNYLLIKAKKREYIDRNRGNKKIIWWEAEKVKFVNVDSNPEPFKQLVKAYAKRYQFPIATALLALLGYHPDIENQAEAYLLLLARLIPAVSIEPVHGLELTTPGTGKTTVALIYELALGWHYFAEIPSLATLVGDARTGTAIIARVNGVWFDEIDAWVVDATKRAQMRELIESLLTGMWQGVWKRSKGGVKSIEVHNPVPLWHSGNMLTPVNPRDKIVSIIKSAAPDKAMAYNDRIAIAISATKEDLPEVIQDYTLARKSGKQVFGKPSAIRGAAELLQKLVAEQGIEPVKTPFKGRKSENYKRVYKALTILLSKSLDKVEYDEELVAKLAEKYVKGVVIA